MPLHDRDVDRWTLRLVAERGALLFECGACWHISQVDVPDLIARFGAHATVGSVRARMICRKCRRRNVRSLVRLRAWRKERAWIPAPPRAGR